MARALLSAPGLIVADEPTQGVDVGARAEIYRILREVSSSGTPVIVNSSDAAELEGLCDRVVVLSRGRVVETLSGDDVNEARIVAAAVNAADPCRPERGSTARGSVDQRRMAAFSAIRQRAGRSAHAGDHVCSALYIFSSEPNFLSFFNISNILHAGDGAWASSRSDKPSRC